MKPSLLPLRQRALPIVTLLFLAPVIVDFLFGASRLSTLPAIVPEVLTYGCAAALIRAVVRRLDRGWGTIVVLGVAYALLEECLIVQTSLAPLGKADPATAYGRALGVNWGYLVWAVGYETVWSMVIPMKLTELIFPDRRKDPWLGKVGIVIMATVFVFGSIFAWHTWTQVVVPKYLHQPLYHPPLSNLGIAFAFVILLIIVALGPWRLQLKTKTASVAVPSPWVLGVFALCAGWLWFALTIFPAYSSGGILKGIPAIIPLLFALGLAAGSVVLIARWASSSEWSEIHCFALISGALIASMSAGFVGNSLTLPIDLIGKIVLNLGTLVFLAWLWLQLRKGLRGKRRSEADL